MQNKTIELLKEALLSLHRQREIALKAKVEKNAYMKSDEGKRLDKAKKDADAKAKSLKSKAVEIATKIVKAGNELGFGVKKIPNKEESEDIITFSKSGATAWCFKNAPHALTVDADAVNDILKRMETLPDFAKRETVVSGGGFRVTIPTDLSKLLEEITE